MKKILLSILVVIAAFGVTFSQINVHVGASTTVNGMIMLDQGLNTDPQYIEVYDIDFAPIGANFGIDFTNKFGLQIESIYATYQKVYEIKETVQNTNIGELKFDMNYLQLPMLLKFMNGSDSKARMNFMFGPQLNILTKGQEVLQLSQDAQGQSLTIPDIPNTDVFDPSSPNYDPNQDLLPPDTQFDPATGQFTIPQGSIQGEGFSSDLLGKNLEEEIASFRNQEIHIVGGFGLDLDVSPKLYLSLLIKADYAITDMRNGDLIDQLQDKTFNGQDLYNRRANVAIGAQITVNYMFNGTRYFLKML